MSKIVRHVVDLLPGVALAAAFAWIAGWAAAFAGETVLGFEKSPVSPILVAIVLGLVVRNVIGVKKGFDTGIRFCTRRALRAGIALLGLSLSILSVTHTGLMAFPLVIMCITTGLIVATLLSRALKIPETLGALIAVGTGICGASAIAATAPVIGAKDEEASYAVANIALFGMLGTLVYPFLVSFLYAADHISAGMFLGTSIHDTSQVTGAGMIYSDLTGSPAGLHAAVTTKLVRNMFMIGVIPLMGFLYNRTGESGAVTASRLRHAIPKFVIAFVLMAGVRYTGDLSLGRTGTALYVFDTTEWEAMLSGSKHLTKFLLTVAMAGVGLNTGVKAIRRIGFRPFYVGMAAAATVGIVSYTTLAVMTMMR